MKVVGYISSYRTHEIEREIEIKIQKERIRDFCKNHSFQLLEIYEETTDSRPDFKPVLNKLIHEASKKQFEKIIILKIDRIGTDDIIKNWVVGELSKYEIELISLTDYTEPKPTPVKADASYRARSIKERVRDIPSLPEVVTKVMELVQDPKSSASQLSSVIAHDPGLTSRVLRLVNSAYYGFPKQISSIQHAIMILGFTTMRGLVLSSSIFKIFAPKHDGLISFDYKKFWKHSLITAIASKNVNKYLQFQDDDDIFSAAILHDIGKIILDQYDHDNYVKAITDAPHPIFFEKVNEAEEKYCGVAHSLIGQMVAEGWNLPENISRVINFHHDPLASSDYNILASVVYIGNILAHCALDLNTIDIKLFDRKVLEYLGLSEHDIFNINVFLLEEIETMGDLESFFK